MSGGLLERELPAIAAKLSLKPALVLSLLSWRTQVESGRGRFDCIDGYNDRALEGSD